MSSLNIGNICELTGESEHFSLSTVDEITVLFIGSSEVGPDIDIKFAHVDDQNYQV